MTNNDTPRAFLASAYLDRARQAAMDRRFNEAERFIAQHQALLPDDHRAPLLIAQIRLREGRLENCQEALQEARRLGHTASDNDRMLDWLRNHEQVRSAPRKQEPQPVRTAGGHQSDNVHDPARLGTTKDLLISISVLRRAVNDDEGDSLSRARLGEALVRKSLHWGGDRAIRDAGTVQARRAIAANPGCAEAHTAIGYAHYLSGALFDARREYRRAIHLNEDEWLAHRLLGAILTREGDFEDAVHLLNRAIALRPDYISTYDYLYTSLSGMNRFDAATAAADRGIDRARELLELIPKDQNSHLYLASLLARRGLREESLAEVARAHERNPKDGFTCFHIGVVHAILGNREEAIKFLVLAQSRKFHVRSEKHNAEFDILRNLPEFQALVQ